MGHDEAVSGDGMEVRTYASGRASIRVWTAGGAAEAQEGRLSELINVAEALAKAAERRAGVDREADRKRRERDETNGG